MPSSTIENYAKNIYLLSQQSGREQVPMGEVAKALGVVPGTATTMVKSLARHGYADYEPRAGVSLNARGTRLALQVLRRHRLIETFLVQTLGMDWSEIHDEAEALEHAVSERMLHYLDTFLGHPEYDPHGDPIPNAKGQIPPRQLRPLNECAAGTQTRIRRIMDQEEAFLRFIQDNRLVPGASIVVRQFNASAQCLEIEVLSKANQSGQSGAIDGIGQQATSTDHTGQQATSVDSSDRQTPPTGDTGQQAIPIDGSGQQATPTGDTGQQATSVDSSDRQTTPTGDTGQQATFIVSIGQQAAAKIWVE